MALGLNGPLFYDLRPDDMLQALVDPQTLAREMVVAVEHSQLGAVETLGLPVKFSATPGKVRTGAPLYGEHTRQVLYEYGFDDQQIDSFEKEARSSCRCLNLPANGGRMRSPHKLKKRRRKHGLRCKMDDA